MTEPTPMPSGQSPAIGPVKDGAWYDANPHARVSFSRFATYQRCPAWFRHQYLDWNRTWTIPVMRAGHAVQDVLERVFDGRPAEDVTFSSLEERAYARMEKLFDIEWAKVATEHENDPNGFGPWDLPRDRYAGYLRQGLRFHLLEVQARLDSRHPRTGAELDLPKSPTVAEAWSDVRPWHAPKTEDIGEAMEWVPGGWFQGQYDLVYSWTGGRRVVDLKASGGKSMFSTEITTQLLAYAWMERELGRGHPEGLEAWFLGMDEPQVYPVPDDATMDQFAQSVVSLIKLSGSERGFGEWSAEDFPAEPAPLAGFNARPGEPSPWCSYCPASFACDKSTAKPPSANDGIDFGDPTSSADSVEGLVLGVGEPRTRSNGKTTRRFTIANGGLIASGANSFTWNAAVLDRLITQGLKAGHVVRISPLRPWRHPQSGNVLLYDTPETQASLISKEWNDSPTDPELP